MSPPPNTTRRSDEVEQTLVARILDGVYPAGERLPLERELAAELGVGRPTLREAIARLSRDGWLTVRKGSGTLVNDPLAEGTLQVVPALMRHGGRVAEQMSCWLNELRVGMVPAYVREAVAHQPAQVVAVLVPGQALPDESPAFVAFDHHWQVALALLAPNPLFNLHNRSFRDAWFEAARCYFDVPAHREQSRTFYRELVGAAMDRDPARAETVTRHAMQAAVDNWNALCEETDHATLERLG